MLWNLRSRISFGFLPTSLCMTFLLFFSSNILALITTDHIIQFSFLCITNLRVNLSPSYLGKCLSGNLIDMLNMD